ncbi:helix-turn-helix transcriptional regulator [Empedobacter falsenii]|uniref:helix-turn-helix transcriptional regulator n=1 Tax=Empedobacter falsenii TaxID=343874 RepID=UPI002574C9F3|nr:helix-turn-helix transcriptional regulator [Empedobacter falsenii]MDM1063430.1 helix-turn-helix transcriptional regulator [Empedobacter falsenii]
MEKKDYKSKLNKKLCEYITIRFLSDFDNINKSQNKYAKAVGVTSSTISKISKGDGYNIPLSTIALILKYEKISLSDFFEDFNKFYNN